MEMLQQVEHIKAMQKKFSVKKVWVEIDHDRDDLARPQHSNVGNSQHPNVHEQPVLFASTKDDHEETENFGASGGFTDLYSSRSSSAIEGLDAVQMYFCECDDVSIDQT